MATRHLGPARELTVRSADRTRLHVEVRGPEDGPTVVLAHCWATSLASWGPVVRALEPSLRVVLYDQRGHGRSQTPITRAGYGTDKLADDLCAVLEATVPDGRRAVIAGHSIGGMTVMAAGPRPAFADRAAAVLLANTGCTRLVEKSTALPLPGALGRLGGQAFLRATLPMGPANPVSAAALRYLVLGRTADRRARRLTTRMVHACEPVARGRWGAVLASLELAGPAGRITAPTVVVAGAEDRFTPPWHAHHIASLLPRCEGVREVPGIGHMGPLEAPGVLAELLEKLAADHLGAAPAGA
ncbi:alpha/beta fold hydrolase [Nocardiopsis sp. NPDC050513]|uniref:alpha/beta fold hydrolase n=1 Tax=Nocardiopsis sp. NPDC050513 TaxID=3364338 RepID=UPI0037874A3D